MDSALLATKLFIPPSRPGLVPRPRLMERLQAALNHGLVLVSAPAGFGKTTLVSQWARQNKDLVPTAWISLDAGDSDPVRFWDYFISALKTLQPATGETALGLLHAPQSYSVEAVLTSLINDLADFQRDFAIVVDDYHVITSEPVHTGIAFILDHLPPNMHLVIATRVDPALPIARFRGRGTMLELGADDLRFTVEEATALLSQTLGAVLSAEHVRALDDRTEGWPVGLKLAALSIRGQKDVSGFIASFTGSQRYIMDYLMEEVLKQQSDTMRGFLLQSSVLERLTAPLCDYVTGLSTSGDLMTKLEASFSGFIVPLDESRQWYRYHHLFAELLRHQLGVDFSAKEVAGLHLRASQWYEDNAFTDDAIHHALAAKGWERALRLVDATSDRVAKRGEWQTLIDWFQMIPEEILRSERRIYSQYAFALTTYGQLDAAEAVLHYLETMSHETVGLQGEIAYYQTILAWRRSDEEQIVDFGQKALTLLSPDNLAMRAGAKFHLGNVQMEKANFEDALSLYADAFEMARQVADHWTAAGAAGYTGWILWFQGKLDQALNAAHRAVDLAGHSPAAALPL